MAGVIGNAGGGYATVTPVQDTIGNAIQNIQNSNDKFLAFQQARQDEKAKKAKADADALQKQTEDDLEDQKFLAKYKSVDTGIPGIDQVNQQGITDFRNTYLEAKANYKKNRDPQALRDMNAAMNGLETITQIPTSYNKFTESLKEGIMNGKYDEDSLAKVEELDKQIREGSIVPVLDKGIMKFNVLKRDPETNELTGVLIKQKTASEIFNELTPDLKFNVNDWVEKQQKLAGNITERAVNGKIEKGYLNADARAEQASQEAISPKFINKFAKTFNVKPDENGQYSKDQLKFIKDSSYDLVKSGLNVSSMPDYEAQRIAAAKERNRIANEEKELKKAEKAGKDNESFVPTTGTVTKGGYNIGLGMDIAKGEKILTPTYKNGKEGPIKGVYVNPNGSLSVSLRVRKNDDLNAKGLAKEKAFLEDPKNAGKEFEPTENDYVNPLSKPTVYNSAKEAHLIDPYIRGMVNPRSKTGANFTGIEQYKEVYKKQIEAKNATKKGPVKKEINRSDISAKAKAAGYTPKEYEALLIKNGISIK